MDLGAIESYVVGVQEFEADTIQLNSKQWTNEHRQRLTRPGVFSVKLYGRCLFVGSSMRSVGSYALGYFRRTSSCPLWTKEYLAALLCGNLPGEIEFVLCNEDKTREFKAGVELLDRPMLSTKYQLTHSDDLFLSKHFPEVKKSQEYFQKWIDRGVTEIQYIEKFCDSRFELGARLLDKMLGWYVSDMHRLQNDIASNISFGFDE